MAHEALYIPREGVFPLPKPLIGFHREILSRLERHPYDCNVFLMLRFRDSNTELSKFIIESLNHHGLKGIRADDSAWNITNNVYNPIAVLYCCKYGIALFDESEEGQTFNPNVVYELGIMQSQMKNCLILKHQTLPQVPFDLIKDLHWVYQHDIGVRKAISNWVDEISILARPGPVGTPRIVPFDEESVTLAAVDPVGLAVQGLKEIAPRLGAIDLGAFFASAKRSIDVGFPLSLSGLRRAKGVLRDFVRHHEGLASFVFLDPEAAFVKDTALGGLGVFANDYATNWEEMREGIKSLIGLATKATVRLYLHPFASGYSLFRSDDRIIVSPWNDGLEPEESPCLVLEKTDDSRGLFSLYLGAFEKTIRRKSARLISTNKA